MTAIPRLSEAGWLRHKKMQRSLLTRRRRSGYQVQWIYPEVTNHPGRSM